MIRNLTRVVRVVHEFTGLSRTAAEIKVRKEELRLARAAAEKAALLSVVGEDGVPALAGVEPGQPCNDADSVIARKLLKGKQYDPIQMGLLFRADETDPNFVDLPEDAQRVAMIPWEISDGFNSSGYAHKRGRISLKPLPKPFF